VLTRDPITTVARDRVEQMASPTRHDLGYRVPARPPARISHLVIGLAMVLGLIVPELAAPAAAQGATLPAGFSDTAAFSGLTNPTVVRFSPDGRVFVAEKSGLIKVFDSLTDTTPTVFADLRTNVHNFWDRGLLGMTLAPNFPTDPSVYVLYTYDAAIGDTAPRWGVAGATSDGCPNPPGAGTDGCVVSGRLSKLTANGNQAGPETVLINDWCQQFYTHSMGSLNFGADGYLYASAGDGANPNYADYGQAGGGEGDGALREHAHREHRCTDDHTGGDGLATPADGEGDDDEPGADCVVGDGVEPRRE